MRLFRAFFRLFFISIIVLSLTACSEAPLIRPSSENLTKLHDLNVWRLEGRIGVHTAKEAWNANLYWEHDAKQDRLKISGPFNQGAIAIHLQDMKIYIDEGNGKVTTSDNPDALLKARLGFAVPLTSLRFWLLGIPAPSIESSKTENGFNQAEWFISLQQHIKSGDWVLPQKLKIEGNNIQLKLIIDEWFIEG